MNGFIRMKKENLKEKCFTYLGGKRCKYCKISSLPYGCYDFHHIKGNKESNISAMILSGKNWSSIKRELDKCVILCSNCHRQVTTGIINNYQIKEVDV